jgi:hypothetical protein
MAVNDDLLLSLYLDGRLDEAARAAFEGRLAAEPALRARLDALGRLQALSARLAPAAAAFSGDDVRLRALGRGTGRWARLGLAAAAALALVATHAGVYVAGARRGADAERARQASVARTEEILERAAMLDAAAPPERLEDELQTLRQAIPPLLVALERAPEAALQADVLRRMDATLRRRSDAGLAAIAVQSMARTVGEAPQLRLVPATATDYTRVFPLADGRYRILCITNVNDTPRTIEDEGTPEELEARYAVRILRKGE